MKVGERGQITIPKEVRDEFGIGQDTDLEFSIVGGSIMLNKAPKKLELGKWKGHCRGFAKQGYESVDTFIEDVRGR